MTFESELYCRENKKFGFMHLRQSQNNNVNLCAL
jgi:hypothetical protein